MPETPTIEYHHPRTVTLRPSTSTWIVRSADLEVVAEQADIVGMSFVRSPGDVEALQSQLARLGRPDIGLLLKIETRKAFDNLQLLVLAAMRRPAAGVMIARG